MHHRWNNVKIVGCWAQANRVRLLYTASVSGQQSTNKTNKVFCSILGPLGTSLSEEHNHSRPLIFTVGPLGVIPARMCQNGSSTVVCLILIQIAGVGFEMDACMNKELWYHFHWLNSGSTHWHMRFHDPPPPESAWVLWPASLSPKTGIWGEFGTVALCLEVVTSPCCCLYQMGQLGQTPVDPWKTWIQYVF